MAGLIRVAESGVANNPTGKQSGTGVEFLCADGNAEMERCQ